MSESITVEIAFALPERQQILEVEVPDGATILDAVEASGICGLFPGEALLTLPKGIWGRRRADDHKLKAGDRIEIYRPLSLDPREARRRRAAREG